VTRPAASTAPGEAHATAPAPQFAPHPPRGRVFTAARVVRSADVTPDGRLRLDALARYLQEAAEDDLADTGWPAPYDWLVRRVAVAIRGYPAHGEPLELVTFCSATGPRWAERTTTVRGSGRDLMQARAVWVAVARPDGRPVPLGAAFHRLYGDAAQERTVSARLSHPGPPPTDGLPGSRAGRAWPLRASDFDLAGHVNNSVHWGAVEDVLAGAGWLPARAELEYHRPILAGHDPRLVARQERDHLWCWLLNGAQRLASARLAR
jgi:acyl-ACP thioesterase